MVTFLSECYTCLKSLKLKRSEHQEKKRNLSNLGTVKECSTLYVVLSFCLTSLNSLGYLMYAITLDKSWSAVSDVIFPGTITLFIMATIMKPRRVDKGYLNFLKWHFVSFAIFSDLFNACAKCRQGDVVRGVINIIKIGAWIFLFRYGLKLRKSAGELDAENLDSFLCKTVIVNGMSSIAPMSFLMFETIR